MQVAIYYISKKDDTGVNGSESKYKLHLLTNSKLETK